MNVKDLYRKLRHHSRLIHRFGEAWLVRTASGQHQLVGGGEDEYIAAQEWVSLFAHGIVFSRPGKAWRQPGFHCDTPLSQAKSAAHFHHVRLLN